MRLFAPRKLVFIWPILGAASATAAFLEEFSSGQDLNEAFQASARTLVGLPVIALFLTFVGWMASSLPASPPRGVDNQVADSTFGNETNKK